MAAVPGARIAVPPDPKFGEVFAWQWTLASGDTADPISFAEYSDRSVQIEGDDGGGTTTIEGSLDDSAYHTLNDHAGNALSFTTTGLIRSIAEATRKIKPALTGGSGGSIVVTVFGLRGRF